MTSSWRTERLAACKATVLGGLFDDETRPDETLTRMSGADCNLTAITCSCDVVVLNSLTIKLSLRNASV